MENKKYVTLRKGSEYDPMHKKADKNGMVALWYAYNEYGSAVTWAPTKAEVVKECRSMGYSIAG